MKITCQLHPTNAAETAYWKSIRQDSTLRRSRLGQYKTPSNARDTVQHTEVEIVVSLGLNLTQGKCSSN